MRSLPILMLGALLCLPPAEARSGDSPAAAVQLAPARGMLQALNSMSALLSSIHSRSAADSAAPQLLAQYREFRHLQTEADEQPPMPRAAMERHLNSLDQAMNDFRLACARLVQEKFYGSTALGKAVKKIARDF